MGLAGGEAVCVYGTQERSRAVHTRAQRPGRSMGRWAGSCWRRCKDPETGKCGVLGCSRSVLFVRIRLGNHKECSQSRFPPGAAVVCDHWVMERGGMVQTSACQAKLPPMPQLRPAASEGELGFVCLGSHLDRLLPASLLGAGGPSGWLAISTLDSARRPQ